jgi:heme-degrading monooxygenase HmoA
VVKHLLIRIEMDDYDRWLATHYEHTEDRKAYGMEDGPVYRDIDNGNAALFHIRTEDLDRAMQWFRSDVFKEATRRATVRGREFYIADSGVAAQSPAAAG